MSSNTIGRLAETIEARKGAEGDKSYTRQLLMGGAPKCARKLGEEAIETLIAGIEGDKKALVGEAADLIYHLLVLLAVRDVRWEEVEAALVGRMGTSGLEEKAARNRQQD